MKKVLITLTAFALILFSCKKGKDDFSRLILGNWKLTQISDTTGNLHNTTDTLFANFEKDTIRTTYYAPPPLGHFTSLTHYTISNSVLTVDSPSFFTVFFSGSPQYDILLLSASKLDIKAQKKLRTEVVFER